MLSPMLGLFAQTFTFETMRTGTSGGSDAGWLAALPGCCGGLIGLIVAVIMIAAQWKIFVKAGQPGWASIIPIYNYIVHLQIINQPLWLIALVLVPCVNFIGIWVFLWFLAAGTAKAFGKEMGFTIGLFLLPIVFYPILGFGDARYIGAPGGGSPAPAPRPGPRR